MFVTAEEQGLLGTEYYAGHPLYPLETTVAVYNIDALAVDGPARDVGVSGNGKISLQDDLGAAAQRQGRRLSPDPRPEAGEFYRSDHFPFAKSRRAVDLAGVRTGPVRGRARSRKEGGGRLQRQALSPAGR